MFRRSSSAVATSREDPPRRSDRARGVGGSDQRASAAEPVLPFLKAKRAGGRGASTLANASDLAPVVLGLGNSLLTTAPGEGEKPTACHHQTRQTGAYDRTRDATDQPRTLCRCHIKRVVGSGEQITEQPAACARRRKREL